MIRCLCTGATPLARLLSPSAPMADWPPGVEAFLTGDGDRDDPRGEAGDGGATDPHGRARRFRL